MYKRHPRCWTTPIKKQDIMPIISFVLDVLTPHPIVHLRNPHAPHSAPHQSRARARKIQSLAVDFPVTGRRVIGHEKRAAILLQSQQTQQTQDSSSFFAKQSEFQFYSSWKKAQDSPRQTWNSSDYDTSSFGYPPASGGAWGANEAKSCDQPSST